MGCSPSKGKLSTAIYNHQTKALQFGSCESNIDHISGGTEIKSQTETAIASGGRSILQEENTAVQLQGKRPTVCDIVRGSVDIGETNVHSQEELLTKESNDRKDDRIIKNNGCKRSRSKERLRKTVYMQSNLDLPHAIVKDHEAAYAYLTHNIPKYESLLGLLEKATQTQLSLQPMVTLLTLQYEEINQVLHKIATDGEQILEMHGTQVALPTEQNDVQLSPDIPEPEMNSPESFSDLLQHMLYDLIKKIRLVGDSVKGLGVTSLEETSDYFGSLSQLLAENMGAKRAVELRSKQILACLESKLDSENSVLHSEDSGICVENEFHNGALKCCSHQDSTGSGTSTQSLYGCPERSLQNQACVNESEDNNLDKDIGAENSNDDEEPKYEQSYLTEKNMSNWSHEAHSQCTLQVKLQNKKSTNSTFEWRDQKDQNTRRPKTADDLSVSFQRKHTPIHLWSAQRSRSADCLCRRVTHDNVQGKNRFPNDNQKPEWTTKRQNPSKFYCLQDGNDDPFNPELTTSLTPAFAPVPPGKNAVKRLINTFSQGVCHSSNQNPLNVASRFRGRKRSILPVITTCRAGVFSNGNNTNSYPLDQHFSVRPYDVNSFPPPPPEVLMDNSFEKNKRHTGDEYGSDTARCYVFPGSTMHIESLIPSQNSILRDTTSISDISPNGQDFVDERHQELDCDQPTGDEDKEKSGLFILANLGPGDRGNKMSLPERVRGTLGMGNRDLDEREEPNFYANSHPQITPPISRAQLQPSSYSTYHRVPGPTPLPSSISCPVNGQRETSRASQFQRWTRRESNDENGFMTASSSKSFYEALSVFCQENHSASQSKPSCRSTLPRPWVEPKISKERLQYTCLRQTFKRSNPFRPTPTDHRLLLSSMREPHYQESESTTLNNGRKAYLAETFQCSEIHLRCSVSGSQEAVSKITDKRD